MVELADAEDGVAPGQACVLYSSDGDDARVFGGGFIDRTERSDEAERLLQNVLSGTDVSSEPVSTH